MKKKFVEVVIRGVTPLLVHKFSDGATVGASTRRVASAPPNPRAEATKAAYVRANGEFYISAFCIGGTMKAAGGGHKMKGSRKSLRFVVPSAVMVKTDTITILRDDLKPYTDFEVDARPVTIPATKGRIMRYRPRWDTWKLRFGLEIDEDMLNLDDAQMLLTEGGASYGIGDFRPEKSGPFGRFVIESWQVS